MSFYIYENWTAERKAKIHRDDCSFCNNGVGIHVNKNEGRNGKWHGPFANYLEALSTAQQLGNHGRHVSNCIFCDPAGERAMSQRDEPRLTSEEIERARLQDLRDQATCEKALLEKKIFDEAIWRREGWI